MTLRLPVTVPTDAGKVMEEAPALTVTLAGIETTELLAESVTELPLDGAA